MRAYIRCATFLEEKVCYLQFGGEMKNTIEKASRFKKKIESTISCDDELLGSHIRVFLGFFGLLFRVFRATQASGRDVFHLDQHPQRLNEVLDKFRPLLQKAAVQKRFPSISDVERQFADALDGLEERLTREANNRYTKSEVEYRFSQVLYFDHFFSLIATLESFGGGEITDRQRLDAMAVEAATHLRKTAAGQEVTDELEKLVRLEIEDRLLLDDPLAGTFWGALSSNKKPVESRRC